MIARARAEIRHPIPPRLRKVWKDKRAIEDWMRKLQAWMAQGAWHIQRAGGHEIDFGAISEAIEKIALHIDTSLPYRPCFLCRDRGEVTLDCKCQGKEWLTEKQFHEALHEYPRHPS